MDAESELGVAETEYGPNEVLLVYLMMCVISLFSFGAVFFVLLCVFGDCSGRVVPRVYIA